MKTLVVEHRLDQPVGRRIAIDGRHEIGAKRLAERRNILERLGIGLPDQLARHRRMVEPLGQPIDHSRFQGVVVQNGRVDEGGELRLAPYGLFRLATDARPYRIDGIEGRLGLLLRHRIVSPLNGENAIFYHSGERFRQSQELQNLAARSWAIGLESGPMADKLGQWPCNLLFHGRSARNFRTSALNVRSPTASM